MLLEKVKLGGFVYGSGRWMGDFGSSIIDDARQAVAHRARTRDTANGEAGASAPPASSCRSTREMERNVEGDRAKKGGAFAHRRAAIAVRGALGRRRLHHDVGHVTGVISALLDQLEKGRRRS